MRQLCIFLLAFLMTGQSALAITPPQISRAAESIVSLAMQPEIWAYDYTSPVPETPPIADGDFAGSLFIGNSLGDGFKAFSGLKYGDHQVTVGLTVFSAGSKVSAAAGKDRVYIMLGINEIGRGPEAVCEKYSQLIDDIRAVNPEADIYVQSVLPVYEPKLSSSQKQYHITNSYIVELNEAYQVMCAEKQVYYLDIHSALADESGALPKALTWDGVHLTPEAYGIWLDYLKTHTIALR